MTDNTYTCTNHDAVITFVHRTQELVNKAEFLTGVLGSKGWRVFEEDLSISDRNLIFARIALNRCTDSIREFGIAVIAGIQDGVNQFAAELISNAVAYESLETRRGDQPHC